MPILALVLGHRRSITVVGLWAAASVAVLSVLPVEHVHEKSASGTHAFVHRHLEESSHPTGPALEHQDHHGSARFLERVFTKLAKYHFDPPLTGRTVSIELPILRFVGHVAAVDGLRIRGAPHRPSRPRAPPRRIPSA